MKTIVKIGSENYACTIVKVETLLPIEGADKIQKAILFGNDVIVSKNVQKGDVLLYFVAGTKLNEEFCKWNNLLTDPELNKDKERGYISPKQFRVKAIKLKGVISNGMLLPLKSLKCFFTNEEIDELQVGLEFTTLSGIDICEKFITMQERKDFASQNRTGNKSKSFNRVIGNQFAFHDDTSHLAKNIHNITPDSIIGIHYKKHGTSAIFANVLVNKQLNWFQKLLLYFGVAIQTSYYDILYSSRKVIKNATNKQISLGYYNEDIWEVVKNEIKDLIPKGWTLYGEILGYTPNNRAIQSKFDYGCKAGEHKFYVYKISITNPDGKVIYLTDNQIKEWCDAVGLLYSDTLLYYGKAGNLFPARKNANLKNWQIDFLKFLQDQYTEKRCFMCKNDVPEEGIVLRIEHSFIYKAYKLKSKAFILEENNQQEKEEVNIEDE